MLLVEDDPLIRLLVEAVLRRDGLEVRSVAGVAEAIDALALREPFRVSALRAVLTAASSRDVLVS